MPKYEIKDNVVVMPDGETTIRERAFEYCNFVTIIIPEGVIIIGEGAFWNCEALREVQLPSTLQEIGEGAFLRCKSLVTINIPNGVTTIGFSAFNGCESLQEIQLPSTLQEIGMAAFFNCTSLVTIILPNGVTTIGQEAFMCCESLQEVQMPSTLQEIGKDAFVRCESLVTINLPNGVTTIGECAFGLCTALQEIQLPSTLQQIRDRAFCGCVSLVTINIPNGVTYIGDHAFNGCEQLAVVFLPDIITSSMIFVRKNIFENCVYDIKYYAWTNIPKSSVSKICYYHYERILQGKKSTLSLLQILQDKWENDRLAFFQESSTDSCGRNPVHICAALKGINVDVIKFLVDKIPNALTSKDTANKTPIHHACARGIVDLDVMKVLSSDVSVFLVADKNGDTPLALGIRYGKLPLDIATFLYSVHPISTAELKGEEENEILKKIQEEYLKTILKWNKNMPAFSLQQQHGWVKYLANHVQEGSYEVGGISKFLQETCDGMTLEMLAFAKDVEGRNFAMDVAPPSIKGAFQKQLFLFGLYVILETCVTEKLQEVRNDLGGEDSDFLVDIAEKVVEDTSSIPFLEASERAENALKDEKEKMELCLAEAEQHRETLRPKKVHHETLQKRCKTFSFARVSRYFVLYDDKSIHYALNEQVIDKPGRKVLIGITDFKRCGDDPFALEAVMDGDTPNKIFRASSASAAEEFVRKWEGLKQQMQQPSIP